jgi:hypothetical protein
MQVHSRAASDITIVCVIANIQVRHDMETKT